MGEMMRRMWKVVMMVMGLRLTIVTAMSVAVRDASHLRHNLPVDQQEADPIKHVRDHVNLVYPRVRELQRRFGTLNVPGEDARRRYALKVFAQLPSGAAALQPVLTLSQGRRGHLVPGSNTHVLVNGGAGLVGHVVLAHVAQEAEGVAARRRFVLHKRRSRGGWKLSLLGVHAGV